MGHSIERDNHLKDDSDKTNLILPVFATIFKKIKTVHIDAWGYAFSLIGFLSVLQVSEWQKVTVKGCEEKWTFNLWESSKRASIKKEYESKNYKIIEQEPSHYW